MNKFEDKPGPGQYNTETKMLAKIKNEPAFSVGSGKRSDLANLKEKLKIPGPGNYSTLDDSYVRKSMPKYGFGTSTRDESKDRSRTSLNVGPGSYENKTFVGFEGRKNSIAQRCVTDYLVKESRNKPGPGQYDTLNATYTVIRAAPAFKIGSSKRTDSVPKEKLYSPDPTSYLPNTTFTKTSSAAIGFGTSTRNNIESKDAKVIPGPGQYVLPPKAFDKPKFAMGIKPKDITNFMTPGPGQYDDKTSAVKKSMPSFSVSGKHSIDDKF